MMCLTFLTHTADSPFPPKAQGPRRISASLLRFRNTSRGPLRLTGSNMLSIAAPHSLVHIMYPASSSSLLAAPSLIPRTQMPEGAAPPPNSGSSVNYVTGPPQAPIWTFHRLPPTEAPAPPSHCHVSALSTKFRHFCFSLLRFDETCNFLERSPWRHAAPHHNVLLSARCYTVSPSSPAGRILLSSFPDSQLLLHPPDQSRAKNYVRFSWPAGPATFLLYLFLKHRPPACRCGTCRNSSGKSSSPAW